MGPSRGFQSKSRSPPPRDDPAEERPIQAPVDDNRRDVQMQDVFAGRTQLPPGRQEDVIMTPQDQNIPDDIARVVGGGGRPVVNLDDALTQAELQMETDPELR